MDELSPVAELLTDHTQTKADIDALAADTLDLKQEDWSQIKEEVSQRFAHFQQTLLRHFRREEEALYPDALQMVSEGAPEVDIIADFFRDATDSDLSAHTLLRGRLQEIAGKLTQLAREGEGFAPLALDLQGSLQAARDLLARHVEKEETLIFPMLARLLDAGQMAAVRERLAAVG